MTTSQDRVDDALSKSVSELDCEIKVREAQKKPTTIAKGVYEQKTGSKWQSAQAKYDEIEYS